MPAVLPAFTLARRLRAGETVFCGWCGLASPIAAEMLAREGFGAVTIDQQHGLWDTAATVAAVGAIHHGGAAPIVRIPLGAFAEVSRAFDYGAEAVIAPMINTVDDARTFAAAAKYPPLGERSWGPHRTLMLAGAADPLDYLREANAATLTFAMIETRKALANLEAIAATAGIDGLFVGPYDLSTALSDGKAQDPHAPEVEREIDRIGTAARKAGKIPAIYCRDAERALALAKRGFSLLAIGSDLGFLRDGAKAQTKALKR